MGRKLVKLEQILEIIEMEGSCSIQELARRLGVTTMTIRRNLEYLPQSPEIRLVRGMLLKTGDLGQGSTSHYSLISAFAVNAAKKTRIAQRALTYISPRDNILIDTGSTCEHFVRAIPDDIELNVFCFSVNILNQLIKHKKCRTTIAGGVYHESSMLLESREGIELLKKSRTNKAFISASGVNLDLGITCSDDFERELKNVAIMSAEKSILMVDSSKFGKVGSIHFADIEDFDMIITDTDLPEEIADKIRERGVQIDMV
jgi:DeoR family deoxyribose operon repressor